MHTFSLMLKQGASMADGFYCNLLSGGIDGASWEDSQNFSPIGEQQSYIEEPIVSSRPTNKRSKNFTEQEDDLLVQAWLNTSLDAAIGNEQSRESYWTRIHHYYQQNKQFESVRNQNSLANRWGTIQEQVNKFCGYYDRIQNRRQSGMTAQDRVCTYLFNFLAALYIVASYVVCKFNKTSSLADCSGMYFVPGGRY